jgi:GMP synthase (glutamine-hydrolysing)
MAESGIKRTLGILACGRPPEAIVDLRGSYPDLFRELLGETFHYREWSAHAGDLPPDESCCDGWLISGSKHAVYEDHPWIPPLEDFVRRCYRNGIPVYGICFGHQLIAQALGGRVEKFRGGWALGRAEYSTDSGTSVFLNAVHQDQVVSPPDEATPFLTSSFCPYAGLVYERKAESLQAHPEFDFDFVVLLVKAKPWAFPEHLRNAVLADESRPDGDLDRSWAAGRIREFFLR